MDSLFTFEENELICSFIRDTVEDTIDELEAYLDYSQRFLHDEDVEDTVKSAVEKLRGMTEEEFRARPWYAEFEEEE